MFRNEKICSFGGKGWVRIQKLLRNFIKPVTTDNSFLGIFSPIKFSLVRAWALHIARMHLATRNLLMSIHKGHLKNKVESKTLWDRSRRPEGGEWEPIKISSKFESSAYVPKSHKPSSVLTKVWSSYWKAKPTQKGLELASETTKQIGSETEKLQN